MQTATKPLVFKLALGVAAGALSLSLTACGGGKWGFPYRADIQQGNWITTDQVARLEKGMSREQVRFILGTPTLQDVFRANRWDYPYYNKPGYGKADLRRFTVWFENDLLSRWEGDHQPSHQPFQVPSEGPIEAIPYSGANDDFPAQPAFGPDGQPPEAEAIGLEVDLPLEADTASQETDGPTSQDTDSTESSSNNDVGSEVITSTDSVFSDQPPAAPSHPEPDQTQPELGPDSPNSEPRATGLSSPRGTGLNLPQHEPLR